MLDEKLLDKVMISEADFLKVLHWHRDWVEECIGDADHESWTPCVLVAGMNAATHKSENHLFALAVNFNEADEKRNMLERIGRNLYEQRIVPRAVYLSAEAWIIKRTAAEFKQKPREEPRHAADRKEVVSLFGLSLGRKHASATNFEIVRVDGKIQPAKFGPIQMRVVSRLLEHVFSGFFAVAQSQLAKRN